MGNALAFALHGGVASVYEAVPDPGKVPAVIVLHGRWGFEPYISRICDRLAVEGFAVQAPDLYYGEIVRSAQEADRLMKALSLPMVEQEIYACVASLTDHIKTSRHKIGIMGFGMGGQLAQNIASTFTQVAACVDLYGDQPNLRVAGNPLPCPVLRVRLDLAFPRGQGLSEAVIPPGLWTDVLAFLRAHLSRHP